MDKKRIAIAFLIVLTNTIGATAILPMMPLYVEQQFLAAPLQATLVIAVFYAAQFVAAPWLGKLSDRFGRRPILIVSQIGTLVSYLMFIFAAQLGRGVGQIGLILGIGGGLAVVYGARVLDGLTGGNVSVAEAYASDISDDQSRAQALGLIGGAIGFGHILGPAFAVILSGISLIAPMVGAAVMSGVTLLLTVIFMDETVSHTAPSKIQVVSPAVSKLNRPVLLILSMAFVMSLYVAAVLSTFSLYAERVLFPNDTPDVVIQKAGLMIIAMGLAVAVGQIFLLGPLVRRFGEQVLVVAGSVLLLASAIGIASAASIPAVVIFITAYGFGYAICWPSLQSILTRLGSKESSGRLLGLLQSAFSLALIAAPIGAGLLIEAIGAFAIYHVGGLLMGLATVLALIILHLPSLSNQDGRQIKFATRPQPGGFFSRFHH